jgi:S-adenosylmethionine-diacylgycerolhomoserine-N-methlytransferase
MTAKTTSGHAELMDGVYRLQRHVYDVTRKYYLFGRDALIDTLDLAAGARVVEIGCGTGRNLIRIARRYPEARLFGLDASREMLKTAQSSVVRAGLEDQMVLAHGYAEALSPTLFGEERPFDRAIFSYSLSMIPDWNQALRAAAGALSDDGRIHIVDFADFGGLGPLGAATLNAWLRLFHVEPRRELIARLEPLASRNARDLKETPAFQVLALRYAFRVNCSRDEMVRTVLCHVAG